MLYIKLFENFKDRKLEDYFIDNKFLYHYTHTEYLDSIEKKGLIPNKNFTYGVNAVNGVFLTTSQSLYKANLPKDLIEIQSDFYDALEEDDIYNDEDKPIVRLKVDVSKLDISKFRPDDDYTKNRYNYNKATSDYDKLVESLDIWGSIAYTDIIHPSNIVTKDYNYFA
jgi:hypothetical protein